MRTRLRVRSRLLLDLPDAIVSSHVAAALSPAQTARLRGTCTRFRSLLPNPMTPTIRTILAAADGLSPDPGLGAHLTVGGADHWLIIRKGGVRSAFVCRHGGAEMYLTRSQLVAQLVCYPHPFSALIRERYGAPRTMEEL